MYLPNGTWGAVSNGRDDDSLKKPTYRGGAWLFGYDAPLDVLPCFERVADESSEASSR